MMHAEPQLIFPRHKVVAARRFDFLYEGGDKARSDLIRRPREWVKLV